jgi:hypothetical protein
MLHLKRCRPEQKARILSRRNPVSSRVPLSNRSKQTAARKRASSTAELKSDASDQTNVAFVGDCCSIDYDHEEVLDCSMPLSKQEPRTNVVIALKNVRKTGDKLQSTTARPLKDAMGNVSKTGLAPTTVKSTWQNAFINFMNSSANIKDAKPADNCCNGGNTTEDMLAKRRIVIAEMGGKRLPKLRKTGRDKMPAIPSDYKQVPAAGCSPLPALSAASGYQCPNVTTSIAPAVADADLLANPWLHVYGTMADDAAMPLLRSSFAVDNTDASQAMPTDLSLASEVLQYDILNSAELASDILLEAVPAEVACYSPPVSAEYSSLSTLNVADVNGMNWTVERRGENVMNELLLADCLTSPATECRILTSLNTVDDSRKSLASYRL